MFWGTNIIMFFAVNRYWRNRKTIQVGDIDRMECAIAWFSQEAPLTQKWFSGRSCIRSNWNLEMLIFEERGKPDNLEKNHSEQSKVPTNNLTHAWPRILNRTRPSRCEASANTTAPSLLPQLVPVYIIGLHVVQLRKYWMRKFRGTPKYYH